MDISNVVVLLVEDDHNVRFTIRAMLQEMNITAVHEARDGESAKKLFMENPDLWHLILCDWNMPNKTGVELLKDVREVRPDLAFVMITARADETSIIDAKTMGVTAYIRKPFSFKELQEKVCVVLGIAIRK